MNNKIQYPKERTLLIIKPDGVQRSLIGEIIKRIERAGFKMVGIKIIIPSEELVEKHYLVDPEWPQKTGQKSIDGYKKRGEKPPYENPVEYGQFILKKLVKYMSLGPVVAMVWQGHQSVGIVRKIVGGTEPLTSDVGTIRGDLTIDSYNLSDNNDRAVRNLVHASGHTDEAEKEIKVWFRDEELVNYRLLSEAMLYDVDLDGIKE
ncbi:nucleoside-diphosphate kinase [Patescibacteria group bacterium]